MRLALAALVLATPAVAEVNLSTTRYACDRGVEVPVTYVNAGEETVAVLNVEGRQITLLSAQTGPDARYEWPSDGSGYVWTRKGAEATLLWKDAEKGEEVTLYAFCTEAP